MSDPDLNLLQGTLDVLILKSLAAGPRHGYSVSGWIRETTDGSLQVAANVDAETACKAE